MNTVAKIFMRTTIALCLMVGMANAQFAQARPAGPKVSSPTTFVYGEDTEFNQIRVWPGSLPNSPAVVLVPGGGWQVPGPLPDNASPALAYFQSLGWTVFQITYRPTFEPNGDVNQYPVPMQDTSDAIAWVRENAYKLDIDPTRVYGMGRSAGAYNLQWAAYEGPEQGRPDAMLLFSIAISSCLAHNQQKVNGLADMIDPVSTYGQQKFQNISQEIQILASPLFWMQANPGRVLDTPTLLVTNKAVEGGVASWGSPWAPLKYYEGKAHDPINTYWTQETACDLTQGSEPYCPEIINFLGNGYNFILMGRTFWVRTTKSGTL